VEELLQWASRESPRGEVCLAVEGFRESLTLSENVRERIAFLKERCGLGDREVIRVIHEETGLPKKEVYRLLTEERKRRGSAVRRSSLTSKDGSVK
jgi:16S rRNA C1402 (ribose-2'-O) methylase RsmI